MSKHHEWGFVGGPMAHPKKSKIAAAAIFNFGKNINNSGLDEALRYMNQISQAMRKWPIDQRSKPEVYSRDVIT